MEASCFEHFRTDSCVNLPFFTISGKMNNNFSRIIIALVLLALALAGSINFATAQPPVISLAGSWRFQLDPKSEGVAGEWFKSTLPDRIELPGSCEQRGFGVKPDQPEVRRLTHVLKYVGPAWYQRQVVIPKNWTGKRVELFLERCHWETTVWVDGQKIGMQNSLSTPHIYDLGELSHGKHTLIELVEQRAYRVHKDQKRHLLVHLIKEGQWRQVLIFTRTKHGANRLTQQIQGAGIEAAAIHGNKSQAARVKALDMFKRGEITALVATEVAARGLDIKELPQVVNYELPNVPEDYVHRIGRTGRAGAAGEAISLVSSDESSFLRDIERVLRRTIPVLPTPEFKIVESAAPAGGSSQGSRPQGGGSSGRFQHGQRQGHSRGHGGPRRDGNAQGGGHAQGSGTAPGNSNARIDSQARQQGQPRPQGAPRPQGQARHRGQARSGGGGAYRGGQQRGGNR